MYKKEELLRIYGSVSTYDNLLDNGDLLIKFIDSFIDKIIMPLNRMELRIEAEGEGVRDTVKNFKKNWNNIKDKIANGKIHSVYISCFDKNIFKEFHKEFWSNSHNFNREPDVIEMGFRSNANLEQGVASLIDYNVQILEYEGCLVPKSIQDYFVDITKQLLSSFPGSIGEVTIDSMSYYDSNSPHEYSMGLETIWSSQYFKEYYRGYFWGNFLSKNHVMRLGGIEQVKNDAPVYKVEELEDGGAYMQLTENINDFTLQDLLRLKRYLEKILLSCNPYRPEYRNPESKGRFIAD